MVGRLPTSGLEAVARLIQQLFHQPPIGNQLIAAVEEGETLRLLGTNLRGPLTRVAMDGVDGTIAFISDEQIDVVVPAGALKIGLAAVRLLDVPAAAKPVLHRLVEITGETATLSIRDGWTRMYLDQVLSPKEVRMSVSVGHSYPLHAGSSSKAILAALPDPEIEEYLHTGKRDRLTAATIVDPVALRNEIATIRRLGYATSRGERQADAGSVASAVYQADGRVFGSLSVCGPAFRFDAATQRRIGAIVRDVGDELSKTVGYHA